MKLIHVILITCILYLWSMPVYGFDREDVLSKTFPGYVTIKLTEAELRDAVIRWAKENVGALPFGCVSVYVYSYTEFLSEYLTDKPYYPLTLRIHQTKECASHESRINPSWYYNAKINKTMVINCPSGCFFIDFSGIWHCEECLR